MSLELTGDIRQARKFGFLDAGGQVVVESQGSSRRFVGKCPVKPTRPEDH